MTSVHKTGDTLTVTYDDKKTATYTLARQESNTEFKLLPDNHGGTELILVHVVGVAHAQHDVVVHLI